MLNAKRNGSPETLIKPSNGPSSSTMRNTAAATETAAMHSTVITVPFLGAYKPKLANVADNQKITAIRNVRGMLSPASWTRQRALSTSSLSRSASFLNHH